jgi:DNA-binding HxlR family transcriptional regulator
LNLNWPEIASANNLIAPEKGELTMTQGSYSQFCPVAMAAEIICNRWTLVLLRELVSGSTRFNDLRRGVPRMSPALLSKRLKDLEKADIVRRVASRTEPGVLEYHLTQAGQDMKPVIEAVGIWGQRWVEANPSLQNLDADLLMWDMRRSLNLSPMPRRRSVIKFHFAEQQPNRRHYWLVVTPETGVIDLCSVDPGFDVDLFVEADLRTMTEIWMGLTTVRATVDDGRMMLTGDGQLAAKMQLWLGLSPFASEKKRARA